MTISSGEERCAECDKPLSRRPDKRGRDELGRAVHLGCMTMPSEVRPVVEMMREIFGGERHPGSRRKAAEMTGHQITESRTEDHRYRWQCSCGMGATLVTKRARQADVERHQAMAIYD